MLEKAKQLNKEQLKYITAQEIIKLESEKLNDQEIKSKAEQADTFYKNNFEKTLKLMIFKQILEKLGGDAVSELDIAFARGFLAGLGEIDSWFKEQSGIVHPEPDEEEESVPEVG